MAKRGLVLVFAAALLNQLAAPLPARADSAGEAILRFLQNVACSQLPMATCEALDAGNARNILNLNRFLLLRKFCGYSNFNEARQELETNPEAVSPECRQLLDITKDM